MGELQVTGVSRAFGGRVALDEVTFAVRPGRLTGFVGANGAGKTTTMRIVMGVLTPDAGHVTLDGADLTLAVRSRFGYMPEERGLYPRMRVAEQLVYLGRVHGLDAPTARRHAGDLLGALALEDHADDLLQTLSLGNQQRVQVAAALVHDPTVLVLDEPFSGLDPLAVDELGGMLRDRAAAGVPVLFSSHQLELVERLCDDVVIIDEGRVVAAGSADELRAGRSGRRYRVVLDVDSAPDAAPDAVPDAAPDARDPAGRDVVAQVVGEVPGASLVPEDPSAADDAGPACRVFVVELPDGADEQVLLAAAQARGRVRELAVVRPTLAQIFREVVR